MKYFLYFFFESVARPLLSPTRIKKIRSGIYKLAMRDFYFLAGCDDIRDLSTPLDPRSPIFLHLLRTSLTAPAVRKCERWRSSPSTCTLHTFASRLPRCRELQLPLLLLLFLALVHLCVLVGRCVPLTIALSRRESPRCPIRSPFVHSTVFLRELKDQKEACGASPASYGRIP